MLSIGFQENQGTVNSWINTYNLTYPVVYDASGTVSTLFIPVQGGYLYFPHNTLIDTWQTVRHSATGFNHSTIQNLVLSLMDPIATANTNILNFGEVIVGESAELDFTVENAGTGILEVTNITSTCPSFSPNPTSGTIYAVDDLLTVTVTYTPLHTGQCNETLTVTTNDEDIVIDLRGEGVSTAVPSSEELAIPTTLGLESCYPNPFNSETVIPYRLPQNSDISIAIYSVNGRLVETMDLGHQSAGYHRETWSSTGVTTGVYFVELRADGRPSDIQKILFLK